MYHFRNPDPTVYEFERAGETFIGTIADLAEHLGCCYSEANDATCTSIRGNDHPSFGWYVTGRQHNIVTLPNRE